MRATNFIYHPPKFRVSVHDTPAVRDISHRPEVDRYVYRKVKADKSGKNRDGNSSLARKRSSELISGFFLELVSSLLAARFSSLNTIMQTRSIII